VALTRMNSEADIRDVLPAVRVPTFVIHRSGDKCLRVEEGRYVASRIPGARFAELPGVDHLPFVGDQDTLLDEVQGFLTSVTRPRGTEPVLATVLSANFKLPQGESAAGLYLLHRLQHHVDRELDTHRGRDYGRGSRNLLASFDGPARAIRCAAAIAHHAAILGIEMIAGLHAGECEIVGDSIQGLAVETARQIQQQAGPKEILVSATLRDLVAGSGLRFEPRGFLACRASERLPLLSVDHLLSRPC
jgi:hypothetical protein